MFDRIHSRLTFANVISLLALFVALGGSSYAAIKVTGKNVKDSSLTGKDLKNSSLTGADVKNGSLLTGDFAAGQVPAGQRGPKGDTGAKGETGTQGQPGEPATRYWAVVNQNGTLARGSPGATSLSSGDPPNGQYVVEWVGSPNVATCAYVATIGPPGTGASPFADGVTGQVSVTAGSADQVSVETLSDDGASLAPNAFHVAMLC